ncbi:MAG TPA: PP2C family protein-serine/threonine phosphatase [Pseudonocardia sp.]
MSDVFAPVRPGIGELLRDLDHAPPAELVDVCAGWLSRHVGAEASVLLLADYAEASLQPVAGGPTDGRIHPQDLMDSAAGEAYREQRQVTAVLERAAEAEAAGAAAGGLRGQTVVVYLPVSVRAERIGVLAVTLAGAEVSPKDAEILDDVARVLGHVLTGARRYTDRFEMLRRRRELGLAAEIQWELLPSLAFELPRFSIAGTVEPAYEIGGDNFDYAVSATRLTVAVSDAAGHGLRSALLASLVCTAMRNVRRAHATIVEQAEAANTHLVEQFPGSDFVTGLVLDLDVETGAGMIINAGHPPPLLVRDGTVTELAIPPAVPMGLLAATRYPLHPIQLRSGDRLVLLTDGITEAHKRGEPEFGYPRLVEMLERHGDLQPPELVRRVTREVCEACDGELGDDATLVCLDWRSPRARG